MKQIFFIIVSCIFIVQSKLISCQFGPLYNTRPARFTATVRLLQQSTQQKNNARNLAVTVRNPIRITLNTNQFLTVKSGANGASPTTKTKLDFIKRAMEVAERFYQLRLKVYPLTRILAPSMCHTDYQPSDADRSVGISSSDLHIYVLYNTDKSIQYDATGVSCLYISGNTIPDSTFQQGRPIMGRIIFNTYTLIDQQTSLTNRLFAYVTSTALHQTLHILGFDSSMYSTYLDQTGNLHSSTITTTQFHPTRSLTTLLTTPYVTDWAQKFFDCSNITGMQLEDEDGGDPLSSHWERLVMYDQLMTATSLGAHKGISGLTFALLKDMGWYIVDDTFNDTSNYGYHQGCELWQNGCNSSTKSFDAYFCDPIAEESSTKCVPNFMSKSSCFDANGANSNGFMSNRCSMYQQKLNCVDPNQLDDGYKAYTLQAYNTDSFCVISSMGSVSLSSSYQSRCYTYSCISSNKSISFKISTYSIICNYGDVIPKTTSGLTGSLQCPKYEDFCQQSPKICKNWCSKNGFCTRGICNCLIGYSGQDCSKTICNQTAFYNPSSGTCLSSCGSGTYQNIYSRTCQPCNSKCFQCKGQPQICTSCPVSNPPQVSYQSQCISSCPANTYQGGSTGDQCFDCDSSSPYFCTSCIFLTDNCTSCSSADGTTRYLFPSDGTNKGICVTGCSGFYPYHDIINYKCVNACQYNLINKTGQICDKCDIGTYKLVSSYSCVASCGNSFYQNQDLRLCQQCDSSCKTCDGQYSQNCTSCKSDSPLNLKYLLLKMCLTDCPGGFYPNDNTSSCQICPIAKFCATCEVSGNVVLCTSCKYGYFYQQDQTCTTECTAGMYKNLWNHTCLACLDSCKTCIGPSESSCTSCDGLLFITNITGSYCIDACPTQGYYSDTVSCLLCDKTCLTCSSDSNYDCIICADGLFKSTGLCRYICPQTYYPSAQTKNCQSCDNNCTFCFGPSFDQCIYCIDGMYLQKTTCVHTCPEDQPPNKWNVCFCENAQILWILFVLSLISCF